ncbi:MAG: tryptophan--tRNA ligase [Actinobacteria bacterium]|jgi:tryptophanyl-tRNA synthetase|nr:tryptophan--tRNA ligase [Actinomycetota bacterium]
MTAQPRVLSGIQPTADSFHIGNVLGALNQWADLQSQADCFYAVVDLHAITVAHDPAVLHQRTLTSYAQLLAVGLDSEKSTIFVQSQVPEHAQLQWVLGCITGMGEASRMTQFKDKSSKEGSGAASVGLFTYPILQAADILLYAADEVPVGEDQRQHLELSRDLAERFNTRFGQTFVVPKTRVIKGAAKILDLQDPTSKMSKSLPAGCVFLLDDPKVIAKKIKTAVTDSDMEIRYDLVNKPGVSNLLTILSAFSDLSVEECERELAGKGYGDLKGRTAEVVLAYAEQYSTRTREFLADRAELERIMLDGATKARAVAAPMLAKVYERLGFVHA